MESVTKFISFNDLYEVPMYELYIPTIAYLEKGRKKQNSCPYLYYV